MSTALAGKFFTTSATWESQVYNSCAEGHTALHGPRLRKGYSPFPTVANMLKEGSFKHLKKPSVCVLVAQSCPTLCNPMDYSPPDSSVHGILQARILEWVAILFFKESLWPMDRTLVSCIAGGFFTIWVTKEAFMFYLK